MKSGGIPVGVELHDDEEVAVPRDGGRALSDQAPRGLPQLLLQRLQPPSQFLGIILGSSEADPCVRRRPG